MGHIHVSHGHMLRWTQLYYSRVQSCSLNDICWLCIGYYVEYSKVATMLIPFHASCFLATRGSMSLSITLTHFNIQGLLCKIMCVLHSNMKVFAIVDDILLHSLSFPSLKLCNSWGVAGEYCDGMTIWASHGYMACKHAVDDTPLRTSFFILVDFAHGLEALE